MAERILLIQPRWMPSKMAAAQIAALQERQPYARLSLLAPMPLPDFQGGVVILPSRSLAACLKTLRRMRRRSFAVAIILSDPCGSEVGYGEAKLWAFLARARRRQFDSGKTVRAAAEAGDKWRRFYPLALARFLARCRPRAARPVPPQVSAMQSRLQANMLLLHVAPWLPENVARRLLCLENVADRSAFEAAARQSDWQLFWQDSGGRWDLAIVPEATEKWRAKLAPHGVLLLGLPLESGAAWAPPPDWEVLESGASWRPCGGWDVWLRPREGAS